MDDLTDFSPPGIQPPQTPTRGNDQPENVPKKRGRPALPRDADGNIIYPDGTVKKPRASKAKATAQAEQAEPLPQLMTDEETAQTFEGLFLMASLGMGDHWALMPDESAKLGKCFGPIFRRYPERLGPYMDLLMCGPLAASIVIPRIAVQKMIVSGDVPKEASRDALIGMRAGIKAAEYVQIEKIAREAANDRAKNAQAMANAIANAS